MKKTILSFLLIFTILFNTYSKPAYADPVTIGVTSYEVYTYITLVLTYLGVEFKNAQERQRWIEDEYGTYTGNPDGGFYDIIDYQIRKAKADAKLGGGSNKPEPRQIAIPVPDSLIDNMYNKLKGLVKSELPDDSLYVNMYQIIYSDYPTATDFKVFEYKGLYNENYTMILFIYGGLNSNQKWFYNSSDNRYTVKFLGVPTGWYNSLTFGYTFSNGIYKSSINSQNGIKVPENSLIYEDTSINSDISITLPTGNFNLNWTSPYTGMQTVTMPLTTTGIESPVEVPVIPGEYVEPLPDEVTNPIENPDGDPLINPETGLPFLDPETGLPIFPSTPLVPSVPVAPIPAPETLDPGQNKDYTPNLTEISNGIKQLPERIINPIKKLFIPDKVDNIDFSPLNVPLTRKFPFSIPWDLKNMIVIFDSPPIPPKFEFNISFFDDECPIVWDFAIFNELAEITRFFVLMGVIVGLILITRNLIRG